MLEEIKVLNVVNGIEIRQFENAKVCYIDFVQNCKWIFRIFKTSIEAERFIKKGGYHNDNQ